MFIIYSSSSCCKHVWVSWTQKIFWTLLVTDHPWSSGTRNCLVLFISGWTIPLTSASSAHCIYFHTSIYGSYSSQTSFITNNNPSVSSSALIQETEFTNRFFWILTAKTEFRKVTICLTWLFEPKQILNFSFCGAFAF